MTDCPNCAAMTERAEQEAAKFDQWQKECRRLLDMEKIRAETWKTRAEDWERRVKISREEQDKADARAEAAEARCRELETLLRETDAEYAREVDAAHAEAAVLREALEYVAEYESCRKHPMDEGAPCTEDCTMPRVHAALSSTSAGSALLERVRVLEEWVQAEREVERLWKLQPEYGPVKQPPSAEYEAWASAWSAATTACHAARRKALERK